MNIWVEIVGIVATLFIIISMSFRTTNVKGAMLMRITNIVGSTIFVVYGCLVPAISTAVLNGVLVVVNIYHLVRLIKKRHTNE